VTLKVLFTPRPQVVRERDARAHKDIVLQYYSVPQEHTTFEGHAIPNLDSAFHKSMVANVAVVSNNCSAREMREGPHPSAFTEANL
jgi:hypothetical protein